MYQVRNHHRTKVAQNNDDETNTIPDLDYVSGSDSEDEDDNVSFRIGNFTASTTVPFYNQYLENEQNNHQLTHQQLQITIIHLERAKQEVEIAKKN